MAGDPGRGERGARSCGGCKRGLRALILVLTPGLAPTGCSGGEQNMADGHDENHKDGGETKIADLTVEEELGHQAYQKSTRLVAPAPKTRRSTVCQGWLRGRKGSLATWMNNLDGYPRRNPAVLDEIKVSALRRSMRPIQPGRLQYAPWHEPGVGGRKTWPSTNTSAPTVTSAST